MIIIKGSQSRPGYYVYNAGDLIKRICKIKRINYSEFARQIEATPPDVSIWKDNKRGIPKKTFDKILNVWNVDKNTLKISKEDEEVKEISIRWQSKMKAMYIYNAGG